MADRDGQEAFNRACRQLEQAMLDAELAFFRGGSVEAQAEFATALPAVHAGLMLRYIATIAPLGANLRAMAFAVIDATLSDHGGEIVEIAREAKRKPH